MNTRLAPGIALRPMRGDRITPPTVDEIFITATGDDIDHRILLAHIRRRDWAVQILRFEPNLAAAIEELAEYVVSVEELYRSTAEQLRAALDCAHDLHCQLVRLSIQNRALRDELRAVRQTPCRGRR